MDIGYIAGRRKNMNPNKRAKMLGMLHPLEWDKELEYFKSFVERENSLPLSTEWVMGLIESLDERGQKNIAHSLQFPFAQRSPRKWPGMMFIKSFRTFLLQARHDIDCKQRLLLALFLEVSPLLDGEDERLDSFLAKEQELLARYDIWHYLWALYFHPGREEFPDRWKQQLSSIADKAAAWEQPSIADSSRETAAAAYAEAPGEENSQSRKLINVETKLLKETTLRQKLELEVAQLHKSLRQNERKLEHAAHQLTMQKQQTERAAKEAKLNAERTQYEQRMRKAEQERLLAEKATILQKTRMQEQETGKIKQLMDKLAITHERLQTSANEWKRILADPDELMRKLSGLMYTGMEQATRELMCTDGGQSGKGALRRKVRKALDLLDALEAYRDEDERMPEIPTPHVGLAQTEPSALISGALTPKELASDAEEPPVPAYSGTFYRRHHGGYIHLDNGEVFNITESMVNSHKLQHEAEVQCRPAKQGSGAVYYEIELLFQGDDAYSPIRQYDGYIQLGEHSTMYCVDMNNPDNRYPIHRKDVEIQQPVDGTPCTFNVSAESEFARLSRVYRDFSPIDNRSSNSESDVNRKQPFKTKTDANAAVNKPEAFLEGCTITIIGGQRKWFEDVVAEVGAELVHDTGDRPERITPSLRRSHALFMLLTSTSHRATWEGIEIAKACRVPYFIIQGSKSNLRKLLWDNRHQIKDAQ
jgi:hypothetical protein